ncbi:MAG: hypothetical protein ACRDRG_20875 [Pseudonocardiaceae bacterium]
MAFPHDEDRRQHASWVVRRGRSAAVRGQERGQRRQHLLGNPVAGAGDDHALHVVRGEVHRVPDLFTPACRSADGQDGHRLVWPHTTVSPQMPGG